MIMNHRPSRLECLPNEILIYLFQYFDARDLFHAFHQINIRFNTLLQSLHHLSLTLVKSNSSESNNDVIFAPYIHTLILDYTANINIHDFVNVHRLILLSPTSNQLKQVVFNNLLYLQHLSIGYEHFLFSNYIPDLCQKIFVNGFPCLTSCSLFEPRILEMIPHLTQSTQISILKMDNMDIFTYKDLLALCPNLYFLQFTILNQDEEVCSIKPHGNLRRMIVKFQSLVNIFSDQVMNCYLACVPNLEQFTVYEINFDVNMNEYRNYHWFATSIAKHLSMLRRLKYYLFIYGMKQIDDEIIDHIKTCFERVHKYRYQSRLVLNVS